MLRRTSFICLLGIALVTLIIFISSNHSRISDPGIVAVRVAKNVLEEVHMIDLEWYKTDREWLVDLVCADMYDLDDYYYEEDEGAVFITSKRSVALKVINAFNQLNDFQKEESRNLFSEDAGVYRKFIGVNSYGKLGVIYDLKGDECESVDDIADEISAFVSPNSWEEDGVWIDRFDNENLVIHHDSRYHTDIAIYLNKRREFKKRQNKTQRGTVLKYVKSVWP